MKASRRRSTRSTSVNFGAHNKSAKRRSVVETFKTYKIPLGEHLDGSRTLVRIVGDLLSTHLHVIGPTGTGKTRFLASLLLQLALRTSWNVVVLDPKGDLAELALGLLLGTRSKDDVVLWDLRETEVLAGYDPLAPNGA